MLVYFRLYEDLNDVDKESSFDAAIYYVIKPLFALSFQHFQDVQMQKSSCKFSHVSTL